MLLISITACEGSAVSGKAKLRNSDFTLPGMGQLSFVEHALCPLDSLLSSVNRSAVHLTSHQFADKTGKRGIARVRISVPLGLTPTDEFYLWGLLALTCSQPDPSPEFSATPHYCLRQLQIIDQHSRRGGRQDRQFAESLARLAAVLAAVLATAIQIVVLAHEQGGLPLLRNSDVSVG